MNSKQVLLNTLTPREREIMDIVYRMNRVTAVDVMQQLPGNPANATVRSLLRTLEEKGVLQHEVIKGTFYYSSAMPVEKVGKSAIKHLVETFYDGSLAGAFLALMDASEGKLSDEERELIEERIRQARSGEN